MTRLTTRMRDHIINKAMNISPQKKTRDDLKEQQKQAAHAALESTLPKNWKRMWAELEKAAAILNKTIPDAIKHSQPITARKLALELTAVQSNYNTVGISIDGQRRWVELPATYETREIGPLFMRTELSSEEPNAARLLQLLNQTEDADKAYNDLRQEVWAVVSSCTTVKQLLEVWPECAELLPPESAPAKVGLPAVLITQLNDKIGLPTAFHEAVAQQKAKRGRPRKVQA